MLKYSISLLVVIPVTGLAFCQEPELKSTKAKAAVRDYERKIEDVDEDFEKQLKDLEKSYQMKSEILRARLLSNLNATMEEEAKGVRLEEATEIKESIKQWKERELPALKELMGRTEGKFEKDKAFKASEMSRAKNINAAHFVGMWLSDDGRHHNFYADGTYGGKKGDFWGYDPKTNMFWTKRLGYGTWQLQVFADGLFMEGVCVQGSKKGFRE